MKIATKVAPTVGRLLAVVAVPAALFALPQAALAADECGLQLAPGDTLTCAPGDYNDGITYSSGGDLTLEVTDDSDHLDVFNNGITVTGNGADNVSWDSSTFVNNDIRGTGIVMDYSSGTGAIDINLGGDIRAQGAATHAIRVMSDSGNIAITSGGVVAGGTQFGIQAETGGDITFNNVNGSVNASFGSGGIALDLTAGGTIVITSAANIGRFASPDVAIRAAGTDFSLLQSGGTLGGTLDFTGVTGSSTINIGADGQWATGSGGVSDFGPGIGEVNNAGLLRIRGQDANDPALATFANLENFNNTGEIRFSASGNAGTLTDDRIFMPGTTFTGSGDSVLLMDANLEGPSQAGCVGTAVADCLDLSGGETAGQTAIRITVRDDPNSPFVEAISPKTNPGIVLVDVSGGTSHAGDFVLDPGSGTPAGFNQPNASIYAEDPVYGAVLETGGIFDYALLYDPDTQQHLLATVPQREAVEYVAFIDQALSVWHTTSDAVAGRQADLRQDGQRGGWVRFIAEQTSRDATPTLTTHGNSFSYDQSYSLFTGALIAGTDVASGDHHVLGVHGGFIASSRLKHDESGTTDKMTAPSSLTFGGYGSWWHDGGITVDGTINVNRLKLEHNVDGHEDSTSNILSLGVRAEAGWQFPLLGEALYVQPLVTAAWVRANIDRLPLRDYDLSFKDEESQRAALGVRLGGDSALAGGGKLGYWLTARAWEEYADDGRVEFAVEGADPLAIKDDLSGSFEEVGLGASVSNADDSLSAFISAGGKFVDDADNYNVSIGARLRW